MNHAQYRHAGVVLAVLLLCCGGWPGTALGQLTPEESADLEEVRAHLAEIRSRVSGLEDQWSGGGDSYTNLQKVAKVLGFPDYNPMFTPTETVSSLLKDIRDGGIDPGNYEPPGAPVDAVTDPEEDPFDPAAAGFDLDFGEWAEKEALTTEWPSIKIPMPEVNIFGRTISARTFQYDLIDNQYYFNWLRPWLTGLCAAGWGFAIIGSIIE